MINNFIGSGIKFPFHFSSLTGGVINQDSDINKIMQSLEQIFGTRKGSRFFNRLFGNELYKLIFEPNDKIFFTLATYYIKQAIQNWEKRIELKNIAYEVDYENPDLIKIKITCYIIKTQQLFNWVFPFYKGIPSTKPALR